MFCRLAQEFELPLKKKLTHLSHGMKTKFSIALALSQDAGLIIMDEPTSGLDPIFRRELLERLAGVIQDEGKSILFSTHITSDLERIADYITFVRKGEVVFSSTRDEVSENWGIIKAAWRFFEDHPFPSVKGIREHAYGVEALTSNIEEVRGHLEPDALVEKASLEDIMVFMEQGGNHA